MSCPICGESDQYDVKRRECDACGVVEEPEPVFEVDVDGDEDAEYC